MTLRSREWWLQGMCPQLGGLLQASLELVGEWVATLLGLQQQSFLTIVILRKKLSTFWVLWI
jgi:hypothetical protein